LARFAGSADRGGARALGRRAVNDPDEQIGYRRSNSELLVANGKSFLESGSRRARAASLAALRALEQRGLIEPATADRSAYHVTDAVT